jgi:DNA-binding MarR family transcriptional regulator
MRIARPRRRLPPPNRRSAPVGDFALETFLPYRFAVLAAAMSRDLARVYAVRFGLTIPEWRIVANLGRFGAMNAGDLAGRSTLDKPAVTRALQRLTTGGLVLRTVPTQDRRQAQLSLTSRGLATYARIGALARAWEADLVAGLSADDRRTLDKALAHLQTHLDGDPPRSVAHTPTRRPRKGA